MKTLMNSCTENQLQTVQALKGLFEKPLVINRYKLLPCSIYTKIPYFHSPFFKKAAFQL